MGVVADAVHTQDFPREVESGDLFAAIICGFVSFQGARAHREHRLEVIFLPVQVLVFLQGLAALDDVIQLLDVVSVQGQRQADAVQPAVSAVYLVIVGAGLEALRGLTARPACSSATTNMAWSSSPSDGASASIRASSGSMW